MRKQSTIHIGKALQAIRKSNGYTQEQLAEKLDVSVRYVSDVEQDRAKPSYEILVRYCNSFNIGLDEIFQPYLKIKEKDKCTYSLMGFDNLSKKEQETIELLITFFNKKEK